ncbi:MAG: trigger factor [Oscillospiraceae bacterium]|nr:trigger factor [Oscillospiraceae bacterium]
MIVKSCKNEKNSVTFEVELDAAEFEKHVNAAYLKNRSRIMIPGFRKGKASRSLIESMYGADFFHNDAVDAAAPEAFNFAVEDQKLQPVGRPALTDFNVSAEKTAVLTFRTDVWPEVTLGQYKGLEAEKSPVEVTEEEINEDVERMRKQNARMVTVERAAQMGDTVNIDYAGTKDGVAFEGGSAEGHDLELGSNSFIPGFEEKLVGIKAGEERDLDLTFPEDYHAAELAGAAVVFHVKCNEVKFEELPELDDEFAKDNDFDTLDELKADIRKRHTEQKETAAKNLFTDALVDQAVANMTADIPVSMVEERMDGILNEYSQYISSMGMKMEDYLKMTGTTLPAFRETTRATAEKQTRTDVLLSAVADAEDIQVTDEDKQAEYKRMGESYGIDPNDVEKYVNVEELVAELRRRKAMEFITDNGVAVAPKEEKAE